MELFIGDLKKSGILFLGFLIMAIGIVFIKDSGMGLFPWGVFHQGLTNVLPLRFGEVTSYLGFVILLFSVLVFKTNIGPGTLLNILMVGPLIDIIDTLVNFESTVIVLSILGFCVGMILMTMGKALYISTKLGAGPRDGLFVGVSRLFNIEVKYVKPIIELIVMVAGYLLGGLVGFGTVATMLFSGYLVQRFFIMFRFESRTDRQRSITDYFKQTKSA